MFFFFFFPVQNPFGFIWLYKGLLYVVVGVDSLFFFLGAFVGRFPVHTNSCLSLERQTCWLGSLCRCVCTILYHFHWTTPSDLNLLEATALHVAVQQGQQVG